MNPIHKALIDNGEPLRFERDITFYKMLSSIWTEGSSLVVDSQAYYDALVLFLTINIEPENEYKMVQKLCVAYNSTVPAKLYKALVLVYSIVGPEHPDFQEALNYAMSK